MNQCPVHNQNTPQDDTPRRLRWMYAALGIALVGVGAVGAVLPGLPTTIFLIGAVWCFGRSCPWMERKLIRENKLFAPFVPYLDPGTPIPMKARVYAIGTMWTFILISVLVLSSRSGIHPAIPASVVGAGLIGTICILRFRPARQAV